MTIYFLEHEATCSTFQNKLRAIPTLERKKKEQKLKIYVIKANKHKKWFQC